MPERYVRVAVLACGLFLAAMGRVFALRGSPGTSLLLSLSGLVLIGVWVVMPPGKKKLKAVKRLRLARGRKIAVGSKQRWIAAAHRIMESVLQVGGEMGNRLVALACLVPVSMVLRLALLLGGMIVIHYTHTWYHHSHLHGVHDFVGKALGLLLILASAWPWRVTWSWRHENGDGRFFSWWRTPALVAWVLLLAGSQWFFLRRRIPVGLGLMFLSYVALLFGFREGKREARVETGWKPRPAVPFRLLGSIWIVAAAVCFAVSSSRGALDNAVLSLALLLPAVLIWGEFFSGEELGDRGGVGKTDLLALCGIMGLTLFFCFFRLEMVPLGMLWDDGIHASWAMSIVNGGKLPFFYNSMVYSGPMVFTYYLAFLIKVFGFSTAILRTSMIFFALPMHVYFYLLARRMFGRQVAITASVFLAVSFWPVLFTRVAFPWLAPPVLMVAGLYHFLRGIDNGRNLQFLLAGALFGFSFYFYVTGGVIPMVILLYLVYLVWRDRGILRRRWAGITITVCAALIISFPIWHFFIFQMRGLPQAVSQATLSSSNMVGDPLLIIMGNLQLYLMAFFHYTSHKYVTIPGRPLLDVASGVLLVIGMVVVLLNWRKEKMFLLAAWMVCGLLPGVVSGRDNPPLAQRVSHLIPVVSLLCGLVLSRTYCFFRDIFRGKAARATLLALLLLTLCGITAKNYHMYFVEYANNASCWKWSFASDAVIGRWMRQITFRQEEVVRQKADDTVQVTYISGLWQRANMLDVYNYGLNIRYLFMKNAISLLKAGGEKETAVIMLEPVYRHLRDWLRGFYPSAEYHELPSPAPGKLDVHFDNYAEDLLAVAFVVSGEDYLAARGLDMELYPRRRLAGEPRRSVARQISFKAEQGGKSAAWRGCILAEQVGGYLLRARGRCDFSVRLDGRGLMAGVLRGNGEERRVDLRQGFHLLEVEVGSGKDFSLQLVRVEPTGKTTAVAWQNLFRGDHRQGLLGSYYNPGGNFKGKPVFRRVDPVVLMRWYETSYSGTLNFPYQVEWRGRLLVPADGEYQFEMPPHDHCVVFVDGVRVYENEGNKEKLLRSVSLEKGEHDIRVLDWGARLRATIALYWSRDGGTRELVSHRFLRPPK